MPSKPVIGGLLAPPGAHTPTALLAGKQILLIYTDLRRNYCIKPFSLFNIFIKSYFT